MSAIGLKSQIWNNNFRSLLLIASYPFLIALIAWAIFFCVQYSFLPELAVSGSYYSGDLEAAKNFSGFRTKSATGFANNMVLAYWPLILTVVSVWFVLAYFFQTRMVRALSHAHPVSREEEPELYNMLENLCISRGMQMPKLEIIETHARNAFASGVDKSSYTITVTRGLLQSMQKDEVEAVLGHELAHIINGDVRLLIVSIIFTGMIGFFAQLAWSSIRYGIYSRRGRRDGRVMLVMFVIVAVLWIGYLATLFTRFAISRGREYMADAGSVELTKNPEGMMRALLRLSGKDRIPETTGDIAMMCIENSTPFLGMFATHPPLEKRIQAISDATGTPIPELKAGLRADDFERFKKPEERRNPWLTAQRPGRSESDKKRGNPWARDS